MVTSLHVTEYGYDSMGNLLYLRREGDRSGSLKGMVDDLTLTYDGVRLVSVSDAVPRGAGAAGSMDFEDTGRRPGTYTYDANGSLTSYMNNGQVQIFYGKTGMPRMLSRGLEYENWSYLPDGTKYGRIAHRVFNRTETTSYRGDVVYRDGVPDRLLFEGGMVSLSGGSPEYVFFLVDHLGSTRVVATEDGGVLQVNHYYPYGASYASSRMATDPVPGVDAVMSASQPYRFLGNELLVDAGVDIYDFHARMYDPALGIFLSVDPLAEKYYSVSPYAYCAGNPVRYVDPEGLSTHVIQNENGTYTVQNVDVNDDDLGIYVYYQDSQGQYTIKGEKIGVTPTLYSFYNCEKGEPVCEAVIDPYDLSGNDFLDEMKSGVSLLTYVLWKGHGGHIYDFKESNNQKGVHIKSTELQYRGMPIGYSSGEVIYASARDIGNMGAGIVAATHGVPYRYARLAFDAYQTIQNGNIFSGRLDREKEGTVAAELYGYLIGYGHAQSWFK